MRAEGPPTAGDHGFTGNVLRLVTGNVFAHGLGIVVAPVTARIFAPDAFGIAALFASVSAVIGLVACLRYELAIILPESDSEAAGLVGLCICITVIISALTVAVVFFWGSSIGIALKAPGLSRYLWLLPVSVFLGGVFLALNGWNMRMKKFGRLSLAQAFSALFSQGTKLGLGFAGHATGGVIIGSAIFGSFVSVISLGGQIWRDDRRALLAGSRPALLQRGFRRYKRFPLFGSWSALLSAASQGVPPWILALYFSPAVVGLYDLGTRVLAMPMVLVGGAIAQVFFQRTAVASRSEGELTGLVEGVFKRLVSFGALPILLIALVGRDLFGLLFGERWADAGTYVQVTGSWIFLQFISSPMSILMSVLEKQSHALVFNAILFASRLLALVVGGLIGHIILTLILFTAAGVLCYGGLCLWLNGLAGIPAGRTLSLAARQTLLVLPFLASVAVGKWVFHLRPAFLAAEICLCAIAYYGLLIARDDELKRAAVLFLRHGPAR